MSACVCMTIFARVCLCTLSQVTGILRGYDQLLNLVLEDAVETLRDVEDHTVLTRTERKLGTTVCRGTSVMVVSLSDGLQEVANPFSE